MKLGAHIVGLFWPRDENLWAFGAHDGKMFMGNSKYLFLKLSNSEDYSDINPVWFCTNEEIFDSLKEEGYNAVHPRSMEGILTALRAGTVLYTNAPSDVNGWLTSGSRKVNLWHGMPLKKIGWGAWDLNTEPIYKMLYLTFRDRYFLNYDITFTHSEYFTNAFQEAQFRENTQFIGHGQARNDVLGKKFPDESLMDREDYKSKIANEDKTIFTYLPTWGSRKENPIDYEKLDDWLQENNALLTVKPHYLEEDREKKEFQNIIFLPHNLDIYPILRNSDILITDYSSVFFDFLLLDRPIIFFPYDYDYYKSERGFELDYEFFTPGPDPETFEELLTTMENTMDQDNYQEKRAKIRDKTFNNIDFKTSSRIIEELK